MVELAEVQRQLVELQAEEEAAAETASKEDPKQTD